MKRLNLGKSAVILLFAVLLAGCNSSDGSVNGSASSENSSEVESSQSEKESSQSESESTETTSTEVDTETLDPGWTRLSQEELKWFNENFFNVEENKIVNYFLSSEYSQVKEIDLGHLFADEPLSGTGITDEEFSLLEKSPSYVDTEVHKLPVEYMETVLLTYANLKPEDANIGSLEGWIFLSEYNAYYCFKGDYDYLTYTMESGQKNEDGTIKLQYLSDMDNKQYEVTLTTHKDGYYFVSNLKE